MNQVFRALFRAPFRHTRRRAPFRGALPCALRAPFWVVRPSARRIARAPLCLPACAVPRAARCVFRVLLRAPRRGMFLCVFPCLSSFSARCSVRPFARRSVAQVSVRFFARPRRSFARRTLCASPRFYVRRLPGAFRCAVPCALLRVSARRFVRDLRVRLTTVTIRTTSRDFP